MLSGGRVRGHPLLQAICVAAFFALAGFPVWRLTRAGAPLPTPALSAGAASAPLPVLAAPLDLEVDFAPAPADFQLRQVGDILLEGRGPAAQFKGQFTAAVPKDGVDLVIKARWPERAPANAPAAARIIVHYPDGRELDKTFWSPGGDPLEDVLTVTPAAGGAP